MILEIPIILFAGLGGSALVKKEWPRSSLLAAMLLAYAASSTCTYRRLPRDTENLEAEYHFILDSEKMLPQDTYVITYNPPVIISAVGRAAIDARLVLTDPRLHDQTLSLMDMVLFKDSWWYENPEMSERLLILLRESYSFTLLNRREIGLNECAFYLLQPKKRPASDLGKRREF